MFMTSSGKTLNTLKKSERHTFKKLPLAVAISTSTLMMAAAVQAQEQTQEGVSVQPDVVVVGQEEQPYLAGKPDSVKYTQDMVDIPKTINVVTEDVLKDQGFTSLNDALRNVAGVSTFGAGEGGGGNVTSADVVTIRGFDANGSIYADGIRDVAGYSRDTFNTEQVEVAKGSSSSIYGKGSAGGTVNLVTKSANLNDNKREIQASYDSGEMARFTTDINHAVSDSTAVRLNALISNGGDYFGNGVEEYKTVAIAPSVFTQLSDTTDLTVNLMYMKQDNTPVLGIPFVGEEAADQLGLEEGMLDESLWDNYYGVRGLDHEEVETLSATAIINHQLNNQWNLRSQTRIASNTSESILSRPMLENTADRGDPPVYTGDVSLTSTKTQFKENSLFVTQLDLIGQLKTGDIQHDVVVGAEYYREKQKTPNVVTNYTRSSDTVSLENPETVTITGGWEKDGYSSEIDGQGLAFYVVDTATLNDHWQLNGGVRVEHYEADGYNTYSGVKTESSASSTFYSWHGAVNFKPTENGTVYLAISNAQQPPVSDLAFSGRNADQAAEYNDLDPRESQNIELGTKWALLDDRLLLGAAVFSTSSDAYDTDDDGNYTIGGEQRTQGVELSATGAITDNLSLIATYAFQDSEVVEDNPSSSGSTNEGNGLSAAPEDSASLWLNYATGPWSVAGGLEYSSGNIYWRRGTEYFNTGDVTLANAMVAYDVNEQLRVQLNVSNLTDEKYASDYSARGHFRPGAPRNIKLGVQYSF